jgi:hypothetical protein
MINEEPSNPGSFRAPKPQPASVGVDRLAPSDVRALARFFELLERWSRGGPANDDVERDD